MVRLKYQIKDIENNQVGIIIASGIQHILFLPNKELNELIIKHENIIDIENPRKKHDKYHKNKC